MAHRNWEKENKKSKADNGISTYLKEIKRYPVLTRDEERALAKSFFEAQQRKKSLIEQWLKAYAKLLCRDALRKVQTQSAKAFSRDALRLIAAMETLQAASGTSAAGHRAAAGSARGSSTACASRRGKAGRDLHADEAPETLDLMRLHRCGAFRELRPFFKANVPQAVMRETRRLFKDIDHAARETKKTKDMLVRANLRMVAVIARKYINSDIPLADLIQEGNIGLMRAVEKFDYRLGNRLSTYADCWVRQMIIRSIQEKACAIRVPLHVKEKARKFFKQRDAHPGNGKEHVADEPPEGMHFVLQAAQEPVSLEVPFGENGSSLHEQLASPAVLSPLEQALQGDSPAEVDHLLKKLPARAEHILRLRFGLCVDEKHTLDAIGALLGITRERVRQIEVEALQRLRGFQMLSMAENAF